MLYFIETKNSPRAKFKRSPFDYGRTKDDAIAFALHMEEMGGCGPVRVVSADGSDIITDRQVRKLARWQRVAEILASDTDREE